MFSYYTSIIYLCVFSMIVMEIAVFNNSSFTKQTRRTFSLLFLIIIISAISEWLGLFLQGADNSTRILHITVKMLELSLAPSIGVICSKILNMKSNFLFVYILLGLNAILECISAFTGFIYYVDANNIYHHGKFYSIYIFVYSFGALCYVYQGIRSMRTYQYNGATFLMLNIGFLTSGIVIQLANSDLKVDWIALAISTMMMYIFYCDMIQQTDVLTSLINRRGYENYISHIQEKVIILFFDVDLFKAVNDEYGHSFGDFCLKSIGEAIRRFYSRFGRCFRIGGDEFCVILERNLDQVDDLNASFFQEMSRLRTFEPRLPRVSIGYTHFDPYRNNIQDALKDADLMMYQYKEQHRSK